MAYGTTHVFLDDSGGVKAKFQKHITAERISSILIPCCELMGVDWTLGPGDGVDYGYHAEVLYEAFRKTGKVGKFKAPGKARARYTVTLRNYERYPERNSNMKAWTRFAREIGAALIPDYADEPIPLEEKLCLYAGAEMNFSVNNGVAIVCHLSDYPYATFFKNYDEVYHKSVGVPPGTQFPWANENQRLVWGNDDYDSLMRYFEALHGDR